MFGFFKSIGWAPGGYIYQKQGKITSLMLKNKKGCLLMPKLFILSLWLFSYAYAIDFNSLKKEVVNYVDDLDHPNREVGNIFSHNLAIAKEARNIHITIYSVGLAMVWEEKNVSISEPGNVNIMYSDVPIRVDLSSVSMAFDKNVTLYSQKYAYDMVNFASLLRRYIGKYILYTNEKTDNKQKRATLLAVNPIIIKDLKSGNIFTPFKVFFENIPEDMAVTPTLFWHLNTQAKNLGIRLEYLTDGISWKSDYNLYLKNDHTLDLNSWITIANNSGASFKNANITIVTGKVQKVKVKDSNLTTDKKTAIKSVPKEKGSDYALYTIKNNEDFKNKEEKQISFVRGDKIKYDQYILNDKMYNFADSNQSVLHFSKVIAFENTKTNNLGFSLPQGTVRVYKYDTLSSKRFIGATEIGNMKAGEMMTLRIGESAKIIGEERMIQATETEVKEHVCYKIKLKNSADKAMTIRLKRSIPNKVGEVQMKDTCQKYCQKELLSKLSTLYTIQLEPEQIYELEIRYFINAKVQMKKEK